MGMRIARYYCPTAHETFSLLPDCLASHFPGELEAIEHVVAIVETARSVEAAADILRPDITLPSAVRWGRRAIEGDQRPHNGLSRPRRRSGDRPRRRVGRGAASPPSERLRP